VGVVNMHNKTKIILRCGSAITGGISLFMGILLLLFLFWPPYVEYQMAALILLLFIIPSIMGGVFGILYAGYPKSYKKIGPLFWAFVLLGWLYGIIWLILILSFLIKI